MQAYDLLIGITAVALILQICSLLYLAIVIQRFIGVVSETKENYRTRMAAVSAHIQCIRSSLASIADHVREISHDLVAPFQVDDHVTPVVLPSDATKI